MAPKCTIDQIKDVLSDLQSQLQDISQSKNADLQSESEALITQSKKDTVAEETVVEKRPSSSSSLWGRIRETVLKSFKAKKESSSTYASDSGESSQGGSRKGKRNFFQEQAEANLEILKLQNDIRQMKAAFENLSHFQSNISKSLETEVPSNKLRAILMKTDSVKSRARDLKEIRRKVLYLKGQIPSLLKKQSSIGLSVTDSQTAEENGQIVETGSDMFLPGLHVSDEFRHSSAFEELVEKFEELEFTEMMCLLSFAVFPENKEVKRTMLMYWWIGEGFISSYEDSENRVTRILDEFSRKGLVEPVEDERKLKPNGYKMEPHVHSGVIYLAKRMGLFRLYHGGKLKMRVSEMHNVCLVRGSSLQQEAKASAMKRKNMNSVFNSSERYPDFTFKWFPEMESLKVLYLGRWERTAKRHIEVESTEFLKDMKSLKKLRLASFQGISRIENLRDLPCSLPKLVILDLRACYNLEVLPKDIGSLESLIYLDVSECYMLDRMPRDISRIKTLQVLKGFVISQSDDLRECAVKQLVNLRKLSITVNKYPFKVEEFVESLKELKVLESLKIAWGAQFPDEEEVKGGGKMEDNDEAKTQKATEEEEHKDLKEGEDDQVHKEKKKEDGNEKANLVEEGKKQGEVSAESLKSEKNASPSNDEEGRSKVAGDGDKGKDATEEGKKVDKEKSRSEDGVKKASEPTNTTDKKSDKQEEKGDGEKEKVNQEEGKKKDEVKEVSSKSDKVSEGAEKTSPSQESKDTVTSKPDGDKQEEKRDGEKEKAEEGKKKDEVKAENSEPDKVDKKTSPPQESKDTVKSKPDGDQKGDKQEEKRDGEKDKTEEGEKKDEVKAENFKPDKVDKKTSQVQESKDTIQSKPDDDQRGDKQEEEKRDGEKDKIEEVKKKDEVKAENSKPDKVDKKTSPTQQSKDTIQSKPDDHKEKSKVQEQGEGEKIKPALKKPEEGEAKTQKLFKKVSFSEEPIAPIHKKPATKETGSRISKLFTMTRTETKRLGKGKQEDSGTDTSKLPSSLKKLELECYPEKEPPVWLNPKTLDNLVKLSIKGGNLRRFSDKPLTAENKCGVQILRLKYLHEFKTEWKDLQALFPQLKLLEKYKCPEVAFCPTDGNGVWRSQP